MAKPTPGPWKAGHRSVTAPETEERLPLDVRIYGGNSDDNRANARLIAAAPELLEELTNLRDQIKAFVEREGEADFYIGKANAVIAKATGAAA